MFGTKAIGQNSPGETQAQTHFNYTSKGKWGRKVVAIPRALWSGLVMTIAHFVQAIFYRIIYNSKGAGKAFKKIGLDFRESGGHFVTLFNDRKGSLIVYESHLLVQKTVEQKNIIAIDFNPRRDLITAFANAIVNIPPVMQDYSKRVRSVERFILRALINKMETCLNGFKIDDTSVIIISYKVEGEKKITSSYRLDPEKNQIQHGFSPLYDQIMRLQDRILKESQSVSSSTITLKVFVGTLKGNGEEETVWGRKVSLTAVLEKKEKEEKKEITVTIDNQTPEIFFYESHVSMGEKSFYLVE